MLEKKCREAHPSKSMDIPSNPAPKKWLSMGVYTWWNLLLSRENSIYTQLKNNYFKELNTDSLEYQVLDGELQLEFP